MPPRPLTRALEQGGEFAGQAELATRSLHDHYAGTPTPPSLMHGSIQVICQVGWGATVITESVQRELSMRELFAWQHRSTSGPIAVVLP
jgi:hypothetical protein